MTCWSCKEKKKPTWFNVVVLLRSHLEAGWMYCSNPHTHKHNFFPTFSVTTDKQYTLALWWPSYAQAHWCPAMSFGCSIPHPAEELDTISERSLCYLQTPEFLSTSVFAILLSSCKVRLIKSKSTYASSACVFILQFLLLVMFTTAALWNLLTAVVVEIKSLNFWLAFKQGF